MERATLQARGLWAAKAPGSWWQNDAKSWHLNKALNLSLFTHYYYFFSSKVFSGLYFDILTSPNQDYFFC
jgi:hypothetical protein